MIDVHEKPQSRLNRIVGYEHCTSFFLYLVGQCVLLLNETEISGDNQLDGNYRGKNNTSEVTGKILKVRLGTNHPSFI